MSTDPYAKLLHLPDGRPVLVRPLRSDDVEPLTELFLSLSPETRSCYGPHPFDRETAERLCVLADPKHPDRFVAVLDPEGEAKLIGYMILTREIDEGDQRRYAHHGPVLDLDACASFAPVIADAYQELGLGTQMARHVLDCAPQMGLRQVILMGGVLHRNPRAKHVYEKLGFRQVGEFYSRNCPDELNYDMILEFGR
ncbi:MAG: GNAT family N-acetyltransferase [Chloroflexi bacterium]|nr:GNAT family N-acetyltransferase [Chloroflexota bacterium]